jgi:hypothetical protein
MPTTTRSLFIVLLLAAAAPSARAQRGYGGRGGGDEQRSSRRRAPRPMQYAAPASETPPAASVAVRESDGGGERREAASAGSAQRKQARAHRAPNHSVALRLAGPREGFAKFEASETLKNHVYWHAQGGARFAHYYDGKAHWYGFYDGPRFYWTRWSADRWWWYDAAVSRWLYWNDGYWWWQDPAHSGLVYLDVNDSFYAYSSTAAASNAEAGAVPADAPAALDASSAAAKGVADNRARVSPDGTRLVQIYGERREAFLYDQTGGGEPRFLAFLASGVKRVRFSEPQKGEPFEIMVVLNDGTFDVFDQNGKSALTPPAAGSAPTDAAASTGTATSNSATPSDDGPPGPPGQ